MQLNAAQAARVLEPPPGLTSLHACVGTERTLIMFETLAVFQPARFWLKADAELNICKHRRMRQSVPVCNMPEARGMSNRGSKRSPDKPSRPRPSAQMQLNTTPTARVSKRSQYHQPARMRLAQSVRKTCSAPSPCSSHRWAG
jgi:hypothetical protein